MFENNANHFSREETKILCRTVLNSRDQLVDVYDEVVKGPGRLRNLFKRFDYEALSIRAEQVQNCLTEYSDLVDVAMQHADAEDELNLQCLRVLGGYVDAMLRTSVALGNTLQGSVENAKGLGTYSLAQHNTDWDTMAKCNEEYGRIGVELGTIFKQL